MSDKEPFLKHEQQHQHLLSGWRFTALLSIILLTVLGYLLFGLWAGWNNVVEAFSQVGLKGIFVPMAAALFAYTCRFWRWQHFLHILGHNLPIIPSLRIYIGGFSFSVTPGKSGEALRSVFLKNYQVPYRESFGAFLAERFSDVMACIFLSIGGLLYCPEMRPFLYLVLLFAGSILLTVQSSYLLKGLERILKKIMPERFSSHAEFVFETILSFKRCFSLRTLFFGIVLGMCAWGMEGAACYFLLKSFNEPITLHTTIFIYAFSLLVGAMTFLPAGLGGAEISMIQLFRLYNVSASISVAVTIVIRLTTLWFSVLLGMLFLPRRQLEIKS